jgi:hypothetical protein
VSKSVRLKEHLVVEVERLAREERRSLAQMVELLLEQALAAESIENGRERIGPAVKGTREGIEHPADGTLSPPIGAVDPFAASDDVTPDWKGAK